MYFFQTSVANLRQLTNLWILLARNSQKLTALELQYDNQGVKLNWTLITAFDST